MKFNLPSLIGKVLDKLEKAGFATYLVGGTVRDLLLKGATNNWDFTTKAKPEEIISLFPDSFYDNKFGTVGVKTADLGGDANLYGPALEITTFRREGQYSDRRHPDQVVWGESLEEDLARRDFTINALALRKNNDHYQLIDIYHGQDDLKQKLIRCVGDPNQRFQEDALRLIRAIRLATELKFLIENKTIKAIQDNSRLINEIAKERVGDELLKIIANADAADGVRLLKTSGLLQEIIPELDVCFKTPQKSPRRHHLYDVGTHCLESLKHCQSADVIVRLATLLHDIGKAVVFKKTKEGVITFYNHEIVGVKIARQIASRLKLSRQQTNKLLTMIRWHQFSLNEKQTDSALRRFIGNVGKENLEDMIIMRVADRLGGGAKETSWRLELFKKRLLEVQKQPFTVTDLKVNGHDVMKILSIPPGPKVGQILQQLFDEVIEEKSKNKRDDLLKRIEELK